MMRRIWLALALTLFTSPALADKRVALVVGNAAYQHADRLTNPLTDARNMRQAFTRLGFDVTYGEDVDQRGLQRLLGQFAETAGDADVAVVYYAGHGATFGDIPYVVPIDADFSSPSMVPYEMVPVETLISGLRRAKGVRIAILDACRDNSAEANLKRKATRSLGSTRGLAPVRDAHGLIIAYGTQYLSTAADGQPNGDSPFTSALLAHVERRGLSVQDMFFNVARDVIKNTNGEQRPEISVSLFEPYMLGGPEAPLPAPSASPPVSSPPDAVGAASDALADPYRELGVSKDAFSGTNSWKAAGCEFTDPGTDLDVDCAMMEVAKNQTIVDGTNKENQRLRVVSLKCPESKENGTIDYDSKSDLGARGRISILYKDGRVIYMQAASFPPNTTVAIARFKGAPEEIVGDWAALVYKNYAPLVAALKDKVCFGSAGAKTRYFDRLNANRARLNTREDSAAEP